MTLGQETGVFVSSVVLYNMEEEQPMASYDIADGLVAAIAEHNGRLVTVSDTCLTLAELGGTVAATYFYSDVYLRGYTLGGEEFLALLLNRYQSGSVGQLVTLDRNGAVLGSLEVSQEVGLDKATRLSWICCRPAPPGCSCRDLRRSLQEVLFWAPDFQAFRVLRKV